MQMIRSLFFILGVFFNVLCLAQINTDEANYYTIKILNTQYYVGMENGINHTVNSVTKMSASAAWFAQVWKIEKQADGNYQITNAVTGLSLDGSCALDANMCNVITKNVNNLAGQKWAITRSSTFIDRYRIVLTGGNKQLTSTNYQALTLDSRHLENQIFEITPSNLLVKTENFTDLRENQTPYKNQAPPGGDRGGCTYFASFAALEAAYKKVGSGDLDLSEEFMAITAKMFYLHPRWGDITNANQRENQFAGTQGGGSFALLASGTKIPLESVVPYAQYQISPNWDNQNLRTCNDFNFETLNRFSGIRSATYYGVNGFSKINDITAENLERVLKAGNEIKICIDNGVHCVLIVGFDKTNPLRKQFIIKNSYNRAGLECYKKLEYFPYSAINRLVSAEYITSVSTPAKWDEMKFIGRWDLNFAGWTGTLDIYHLPGSMKHLLSEPANIRTNGGEIKDKRIGVFYDHTGVAHRVNGYFLKVGKELTMIFCFDNNKPNLRWDELPKTRMFYYKLSADGNIFSGTHVDVDGKRYEGRATRKL